EQLGLQELLRQGGAVERDERLFGAWRRAVDVAGHDFLAGTRLIGDQHGRVGLGDLGGLRQHLLPLARAPESPVRAGALQLLDALLEPRGLLLSLAGARRLLGEALVGERQRHVVGDPAASATSSSPYWLGRREVKNR